MTRMMTGGCQCGRIRYEAAIDNDEAYLCHCTFCRRATGAAAAAFKNLPQTRLKWSHEPEWYHSSPIGKRPFCSSCGTSLGYSYVDGENIDLTIGSFDDPGFFRPTSNFAVDTKLAEWEDTSHLPGMRADEHQSLTDRWIAATGKLPD